MLIQCSKTLSQKAPQFLDKSIYILPHSPDEGKKLPSLNSEPSNQPLQESDKFR